jgi:hypothetical protein
VLRVAPQSWPVLLGGYALLMQCTHSGTAAWGQWVLVFECVGLAALLLWPRPQPQPVSKMA